MSDLGVVGVVRPPVPRARPGRCLPPAESLADLLEADRTPAAEGLLGLRQTPPGLRNPHSEIRNPKSEIFPPSSLRPWLDRLAARLTLRGKPAQVRRSLAAVERFLAAAGIETPDGVTESAIEAYAAARLAGGASPRTVRNHLSAIRQFCRVLQRGGALAVDPSLEILPPPAEELLPVFLDEAECRLALAIAAEAGCRGEVGLALYTGLRAEELRQLRWSDVDMDRRCLYVRRAKGRRPRAVPLCREAVELLTARRAGPEGGWPHVFAGGRRDGPAAGDGGTAAPGCGLRGCWDRNRPRGLDWRHRKALRPLQERIGKFRLLPGKRTGRGWHLFRHTYATRLARAGVPIADISRWLGHRSISTTQIYAHYAEAYDDRAEALNLQAVRASHAAPGV